MINCGASPPNSITTTPPQRSEKMSRKRQEYLKGLYNEHHWQAYLYFSGICQRCKEFFELEETALHHLVYSVGYMDDPLIRTDEVQLLCKPCHRIVHQYICGYCDQIRSRASRAYQRGQELGLDIPLCRSCFKILVLLANRCPIERAVAKQVLKLKEPGEVIVSS